MGCVGHISATFGRSTAVRDPSQSVIPSGYIARPPRASCTRRGGDVGSWREEGLTGRRVGTVLDGGGAGRAEEIGQAGASGEEVAFADDVVAIEHASVLVPQEDHGDAL